MPVMINSDENITKIINFIKEKTGIDINQDKFKKFYAKKIEQIIKEENYNNFPDLYSDLISNKNPDLIQKIINTVTINETYFFREEEHFRIMVKNIIPELMKIRPQGETINILSAPCSSGEEVYSILIHLLENPHLIRERDFMIIGIDINTSALEIAKKGIYTKGSMRAVPPHLVSKYFIKEKNFYRIKNSLQEFVSFENVNVRDKYSMKRLGKFDIIFSRNMFIYFDEHSRKETIATFYSMLKPEGYLILGHTERIPETSEMFVKQKHKNSIIYKKR